MRILRGRMGTSPFLGLRVTAVFAGSNSRRLRAFVENPDHSHPLEVSLLSASSLSLFRPCTPTFDNQSHAVGRCFHSSTWRIGVDQLAAGRTYLDT